MEQLKDIIVYNGLKIRTSIRSVTGGDDASNVFKEISKENSNMDHHIVLDLNATEISKIIKNMVSSFLTYVCKCSTVCEIYYFLQLSCFIMKLICQFLQDQSSLKTRFHYLLATFVSAILKLFYCSCGGRISGGRVTGRRTSENGSR